MLEFTWSLFVFTHLSLCEMYGTLIRKITNNSKFCFCFSNLFQIWNQRSRLLRNSQISFNFITQVVWVLRKTTV